VTSEERREALIDLYREVSACTKCALHEGRSKTVFGAGNSNADLMFIGEAPGAEEDRQGLPFVGRAGQLLDGLLAEVGLARDRVAVANVLKCRPPANRKPRRAEVARCRPWLERQIGLLNPALIVALGGTAAEWFVGPSARIASLRGQSLSYDGRPLLVTYHPSAAIRFGPAGLPLAALREDLAEVARLLTQQRTGA
jgi:DNA polymerase